MGDRVRSRPEGVYGSRQARGKVVLGGRTPNKTVPFVMDKLFK